MSYLDDWIDDRDERREQRLRQLGTRSPRCRGCPETDPFALSGVHPDIVCYECLAIEHGDTRRHIDQHRKVEARSRAITSADEPTTPMT